MSKFKSGDVVINDNGNVHLYVTDTHIIHLIHDSVGKKDTSVYPMVFKPVSQEKHRLLFNIGEFLARYLKYENTVHPKRIENIQC